jgi:hypothetical protein
MGACCSADSAYNDTLPSHYTPTSPRPGPGHVLGGPRDTSAVDPRTSAALAAEVPPPPPLCTVAHRGLAAERVGRGTREAGRATCRRTTQVAATISPRGRVLKQDAATESAVGLAGDAIPREYVVVVVVVVTDAALRFRITRWSRLVDVEGRTRRSSTAALLILYIAIPCLDHEAFGPKEAPILFEMITATRVPITCAHNVNIYSPRLSPIKFDRGVRSTHSHQTCHKKSS